MTEDNETKVSNILSEFYENENKDKGVTILSEDEKLQEKEKTEYQKCFKKMLKAKGKSIPEMSDDERKKFFEEVKKKC